MTAGYYGGMVQEYYVARVREIAARRSARLQGLKTRADALQYRTEVRRKLATIFGPWPERTPMQPRITGSYERSGFKVERIVLESRPGLHVTGNLYIPHGKGPLPVAIATCGHTEDGKACGGYQRFARTLAEQGYLTFHFDPLSQGERHQYLHLPKKTRITGCVREHMASGKQFSPLGEFLGSWMVWDGMRALDYVLSRPEADPTRVGVTGNSGGGTQTTYLTAMDDRYTLAAPSCFIASYLADLENELPADCEQIPPGILGAGLEQADFFIAQAPRPTMLIGQANDFFDERALRQTYEETRRFYGLLGAEEKVQLHIGPGPHGFQPDARAAMYKFFNHFAGVNASGKESKLSDEAEQTLWAAPRGQVSNLPGNKFTFHFAAEIADEIAQKRRRLNSRSLNRMLSKVLNLPTRTGAPHYRTLRSTTRVTEVLESMATSSQQSPPPAMRRDKSKLYTSCGVFAVETEPGIRAMLYQWDRPPGDKKGFGTAHPRLGPDVALYVPHTSAEEDIVNGEAPITPGTLFAVDPRGVGRSTAHVGYPERPMLDAFSGDFFHNCHAVMLGESLAGRRVHDVLCCIDLLETCGAKRVHLSGRGLGAITAAFVACLHPMVTRVTLKHTLHSFHSLTQMELFSWPMSSIPWAVLKHFDLPDCYKALSRKRLKIISHWDAQMR